MKETLERELSHLPKDFVVLTILPREHYETLNMHMLKILIHHRQFNGAYVAINRPYNSMMKIMKQNNIDSSKVFFLDCVSETKETPSNCVLLRTPESLTNIGISLDPIYKNDDFSFIFLDSLDALSLFHKPEIVIRFARSLIFKVKQHGMHGVMLGLYEDTDKKIIDEVSMVCDKIIDLTKM